MNRTDSDLLNRVYIATPCHVDWDSMRGDERTRFCGQCNLNVYNVAALSNQEALKFLQGAQEGQERFCLRLYRRPDSTVLTDNCPIGLRKIRDHIRMRVAVVLALLACVGFISEVQAQTLVGAGVGAFVPSDDPPITKTALPMLSGIAFSAALAWIAANRRSSVTVLGLGLIALLFFSGVLTGVWSAP